MPPFDPSNPFGKEGLLAVMVRITNERDQSHRFTKKGDKRQWFDIEAAKAGKAAKRKARQLLAVERTLAASRKRNSKRRPAGEDIQSRMLRTMEPGSWYGAGDLARMTGEPRSSRATVHSMLRMGWVEVGQNGAWSGLTLDPWEIMGGAEPQPQRLYRLTAAGIERRDRLAAIVKPE